MITRRELEDFARLKGISLGNAEKDYLIDIALLSISKNTKNELVFKGGTCLYKFHKLERFSQDIDFSAVQMIDVNRLVEKVAADFEKFGIKAVQVQKKELKRSITVKIFLEGPLYSGSPLSIASLNIDINKESKVILEPEALTHSSLYPELPAMSVLCMRQEEIFAEKIRALLTRQQARDLFDLHFLLKKGISGSKRIIEKKMEYYGKTFNPEELLSAIKALKGRWEKELEPLTLSLPEFSDAHNYVASKIKELYGS